MLKKTLYIIVCVLLVAGCSNSTEDSPATPYQAISALGDTLYAPPIDPERMQRFKVNLERAKAKYTAAPDDIDAVIWYGRRTAYTGNYRKAIEIYSEGLEKAPDEPRLYRHRGHRYITVREFDKAIRDLEKAADLIKGTDDRIEQDGLPNEQNKPRSTLHTNIWYHLGLAYYLEGRFKEASRAFGNCKEASPNDDMLVASSYWLYMSLRRTGMDLKAGKVLEPIEQEMEIIENQLYHQLLQVFKGSFDSKHLMTNLDSPLEISTAGYGIGNWHLINGRRERALAFFRDIYETRYWPAFGYIAAETDLARLSR